MHEQKCILLLQIQANSKSADPTDIQITEIDKKTGNGTSEVEMESVNNGKREPMEIDKMQIEGEVPNSYMHLFMHCMFLPL